MFCMIICGPPASGKSTLAKDFVSAGYTEINRDNIRFSVFDIGGSWKTYKFNKKTEKHVTKIWYNQIYDCALSGKSIVISDTLCIKNKRDIVVKQMEELGYIVGVNILKPPLEELIRRDALRGDFSVGAEIIEKKLKELEND